MAQIRWFLRWRLRRAEHALTIARRDRETRELENPDYGGLLTSQTAEEQRIERRIADLKQRLARPAAVADDGNYCLKCGKVTQWDAYGCTVCRL